MKPQKWHELLDELRNVLMGRNPLLDAILPPLLFLLVNNYFGFQPAMWSALTLSLGTAAWRLMHRQAFLYASAGLFSTAAAMAVALLSGRQQGFFLPGLAGSSATLLLTLISLLARRPLVAWSSSFVRRWPLDWYWHPRVRPAYEEVTLAWALFFAARLLLQYWLYANQDVNLLAFTNLMTGSPAMIFLLVASYLYGTWRLVRLQGPSVDEFRANIPAPWQSQRRGF